MNMGNELDRTAIHEAGHAVVCWDLGVKVIKITIVPDKNGIKGSGTHDSVINKKILKVCERESEKIIISRWSLVEALAHELLEKKALNEQEVLQILEKLDPKPKFLNISE